MRADDQHDGRGAQRDAGLQGRAEQRPRSTGRGRGELQFGERSALPVRWESAERPLQPHRHRHVRQRVAAEVDEALVGPDRPRVDLQHVGEQRAQVAGGYRRFVGSTSQVADGLIVRFARRKQRQFGDGDHPDGSSGQAGSGYCNALHINAFGANGGDDEPLVVIDAEGRDALFAECGFHALQVDAQPVELDEAAAAADHLVEPVGRAPSDVARAQRVDRLAERQVGRAVRVAHHHVRALVHQFAHVRFVATRRAVRG